MAIGGHGNNIIQKHTCILAIYLRDWVLCFSFQMPRANHFIWTRPWYQQQIQGQSSLWFSLSWWTRLGCRRGRNPPVRQISSCFGLSSCSRHSRSTDQATRKESPVEILKPAETVLQNNSHKFSRHEISLKLSAWLFAMPRKMVDNVVSSEQQ